MAGGEEIEGFDTYNTKYNRLSSTEILVTLAGVWRTVEPLPAALAGLRGATLNNMIYMLGETYMNMIYILTYIVFQEEGMAVKVTR